MLIVFFFFNDTATTEIYPLSLHDALPICRAGLGERAEVVEEALGVPAMKTDRRLVEHRSEEHTSELQSPCNLVCRLLLEKKKTTETSISSRSSSSRPWPSHTRYPLHDTPT